MPITYNTQEMIEMVEYSDNPRTFLMDQLVKNIGNPKLHDVTTINIDVVKNGVTRAAYVTRTANANQVSKPGFSSVEHTFPYTFEKIEIEPKDLRLRVPGEQMFGTMSPGQRLDMKVGEWIGELDNRVTRTEESQLAEALRTGKCVITNKDGTYYTIDYQRDATLTLATKTGNDIWGGTTANIRGDIKAMAKALREQQGGPLTDVYLGRYAGNQMEADSDIKADLDNKNYNAGMFDIDFLAEQDVTFLGYLKMTGVTCRVWVYTGFYYNGSANVQYIPDAGAIGVNRSLDCRLHYGVLEHVSRGYMGRRWPEFRVADDDRSAVITMESSPLVAPHQIDSTCYLNTGATS